MAHKKKTNAVQRAAYKAENEAFLADKRTAEGVKELRCGVLYKVLAVTSAEDLVARGIAERKLNVKPTPRSVVTVHYTGKLISGKVFDSSLRGGATPAAFRVNDLITAWQVALVNMRIGERWEIYVPASAAYGEKGAGRDIPGDSSLIFEIELLDIA